MSFFMIFNPTSSASEGFVFVWLFDIVRLIYTSGVKPAVILEGGSLIPESNV